MDIAYINFDLQRGRIWRHVEAVALMSLIEEVAALVNSSLQLGNRGVAADPSVPLLGSLPELDSMAVVTLITALEDQYGVVVEDDEISAETFETLGSLSDFLSSKVNGA